MTDKLTDEADHLILMHREAHFGGDFAVMLDYYQQDRLGVHPDIEIERISYLAEVEKELEKNLAPLILTGSEAEKVARARRAYLQLKALYEMDEPTLELPRLIGDLILTEEEDPEEEMNALVAEGSKVIPLLMQLVQNHDSYDPLFPGYGYAPYFAILCLGRLKSEEAIPVIFECMKEESAFGEEIVLEALKEIGAPAKQYLLSVIASRPLSSDNVNAAFALTVFADELDVAIKAFEQLQDPEVLSKPLLPIYLLCNCDPLKETPHRNAFLALAHAPTTPKKIREEIENIALDWQ